jgi:glycosyltransferase involved in cell wall biosynthesis
LAGKRVIVIPAFNEATAIEPVIRGAAEVADHVIVVDDGSSDRTAEVAERAGALVVRHAVNRGVGGATGTGLQAALAVGAAAIVTMDADGQHRVEDAERVFARLATGDVDFVNGSRLLGRKEGAGRMPARRVLYNNIANVLTWSLFGVWVTDSQCGLRGLSARAAAAIDLQTSGFEVCSEMIQKVRRNGWRFAEVPVAPVYTTYSLSKGQSFTMGVRTAMRLIMRRLIG